ncbi:MAG: DUF402 domain-containing protein [Bacilli bacterium]|nr:DUF402 domain-containing protein [Bacilli bacterium]
MNENNTENRFSKWIHVQAYKHDGSLHREWSPAYLVEETDDYYALASRASLVTEFDGRKWVTKEHAIFILFKNEWKNIICMSKDDGICYYVNIASPTLLDKGCLKYIDYDLDVKLYPNGDIQGLDFQEFERHGEKYGYSPELIKCIYDCFSKVKQEMSDRVFPYTGEEVRKLYEKFEQENRPIPRRK